MHVHLPACDGGKWGPAPGESKSTISLRHAMPVATLPAMRLHTSARSGAGCPRGDASHQQLYTRRANLSIDRAFGVQDAKAVSANSMRSRAAHTAPVGGRLRRVAGKRRIARGPGVSGNEEGKEKRQQQRPRHRSRHYPCVGAGKNGTIARSCRDDRTIPQPPLPCSRGSRAGISSWLQLHASRPSRRGGVLFAGERTSAKSEHPQHQRRHHRPASRSPLHAPRSHSGRVGLFSVFVFYFSWPHCACAAS